MGWSWWRLAIMDVRHSNDKKGKKIPVCKTPTRFLSSSCFFICKLSFSLIFSANFFFSESFVSATNEKKTEKKNDLIWTCINIIGNSLVQVMWFKYLLFSLLRSSIPPLHHPSYPTKRTHGEGKMDACFRMLRPVMYLALVTTKAITI